MPEDRPGEYTPQVVKTGVGEESDPTKRQEFPDSVKAEDLPGADAAPEPDSDAEDSSSSPAEQKGDEPDA